MADSTLAELSELLTSIARQTHSPKLHGEMGNRAGLTVRPHLFGVLARIRDMQPVRVTDVAEVMDNDRSTISRQISELVKAGCVERATDPTDGRAVVLTLTHFGDEVIGRVFDAWLDALEGMTSSWPPSDRAELVRLLRRLEHELDGHFSP
jgi:DNA-binding MarR family transcriptional regulator